MKTRGIAPLVCSIAALLGGCLPDYVVIESSSSTTSTGATSTGATSTGATSGSGGTSGNATSTGAGAAGCGDGGSSDGGGVPLTIIKAGSGVGTVTSEPPGIDCGPKCCQQTTKYTVQQVILHARTENGTSSHFESWSGACAGSFWDCQITMDAAKTVTATFASTTSNLIFASQADLPATLGGVAAYDTKCNDFATTAGINNAAGDAFLAWMSSGSSDVVDRLNKDNTPGGFVRLDGKVFAVSQGTIFNGSVDQILNPVTITERGEKRTGGPWSATLNHTGKLSAPGEDCAKWSAVMGSTVTGDLQGGPGIWSFSYSGDCNGTRPVMCLMKTLSLDPTAVQTPGKLVFFSTDVFTSGGGIAAANKLCDLEKPQSHSKSTFKALLATTTAAASSVLDASAVYVRIDGQLVGSGADLMAGKVEGGIWQDPMGTYGGGEFQVFTGSTNVAMKGTVAQTCSDWTDVSNTPGQVGSGARCEAWWGSDSRPCNTPLQIYCVEQ